MAERKVPRIRFKGFEEDWEQRKWLDTVDISKDMVDPRSGEYDNLPHVAPGNIESFTGRLYDNVKLVKDENLISGKFRFGIGDIIYCKINPQLGKYVFSTFAGLTSADAYVLNAKIGLNQKFLYAVLQTNDFFEYSVSVSRRSGMPKINRDELNSYVFWGTNENEQKQIGDALLTFDKVISLHQRKLEKLKILKKAMLEKMFPQNGAKVPEIRFSVFTDDWEQRKLGEHAVYRRGSFPQPYGRKEWYDGEGAMPFVQVIDVMDNMKLADDTKQKISKLAQPMSVCAEKGQVLVTLQGSIGRVAVAQYGAFVDRTVLIFEKYKTQTDTDFWAYVVKQKFIDEARRAPGGTIKTITKEALSDFDILLPKYEEQVRIGEFLKRIDNLISLHQRKLEKLRQIKKSMLERMFV